VCPKLGFQHTWLTFQTHQHTNTRMLYIIHTRTHACTHTQTHTHTHTHKVSKRKKKRRKIVGRKGTKRHMYCIIIFVKLFRIEAH
jgi:hypothetical protein